MTPYRRHQTHAVDAFAVDVELADAEEVATSVPADMHSKLGSVSAASFDFDVDDLGGSLVPSASVGLVAATTES